MIDVPCPLEILSTILLYHSVRLTLTERVQLLVQVYGLWLSIVALAISSLVQVSQKNALHNRNPRIIFDQLLHIST